MDIVVTTPRLALRRLATDDLAALHALDGDAEVMRFLSNGKPTALAQVRQGLEDVITRYELDSRHGRWAAQERATDDFVGWFSLAQPGDIWQSVGNTAMDEAELGYRLRHETWGRGYATEGARALVDYGFSALGLCRIYAQTMAVNTASRRVMEKVGLHHLRTFHLEFDDPIPGTEHGEVEYTLTRDEWLQAKA